MRNLWKVVSIVAISSAGLFACNHKADSKGSHSASAVVNGPVEVTCVSATDDSGKPTPPACIIDGPGADGAVDIGHKVAIVSAGNIVLTCRGSGNLACTARIDE